MKKFLSNFLAALWVYPLRLVLIFLTYLLYRPKVYYEGKDSPHRRVKSPTVLTCNHLRGCDGAVISAIFPRKRIHPLTARRWYKTWYLYPFMRCGFTIPIDRGATAWVHQSVQELEKGDSVLIFPEGMAVPGPEIRPFKPGFLLLAKTAGAPVLPLYMEGCYNRPFLKRLRIVIGTPYYPTQQEGESLRQYYDRECRNLFEKTIVLRDLLHKQNPKKKRAQKKGKHKYEKS